METLSGTVKDAFGYFTSRKVRAYRQSDGAFAGDTVISDPTTGVFSIFALDTSPHYVVALGEIIPANSTKLLLHMDGADNSIVFTDVKSHTITRLGNAKISTAQSVFGGASAYFDGNGDRLSTPSSADYAFGSGDFTIELRIYVTKADTGYVLGTTYGGSSNVYAYHDGTETMYVGTSYGTITTTVSMNAWHHVAVCRKAGYIRAFIDGALAGGHTDSGDYGTQTLYFGGADVAMSASADWFGGYIDEVRVRKGYAMYEDNFTPPTAAFPDTDETPPEAANALIFDNIIPI